MSRDCSCLPYQDGGPCQSCRDASTIAALKKRLAAIETATQAVVEYAYHLEGCVTCAEEGWKKCNEGAIGHNALVDLEKALKGE